MRRRIDWRSEFERITGTKLGPGEDPNRALFIHTCGGQSQAIEAEQTILSSGDEFLPQCARNVKAGHPATAAYWRFMITQLHETE